MKAKFTFLILFSSFVLLQSVSLCAQQVISVTPSIQKETSSQVLEPAILRVIYSFSQQATKERELIVITDTMALTVGQNYSVYYDWNKQRNDSIYKIKSDIPIEKIKSVNVMKDESALQTQLEARQEPTFITDESKGESARIFKNRDRNEIITIDKGPSESGATVVQTYLQVTEIIPPQDWTITEDTLTVLGYMCQKATTTFRGRNYSAWFTLDIPVNEGPWKLHGLPGMILKAEDGDGIFLFEAIGITQLNNENIEMPADRKITQSTLKQLRDYRKNRFKELMYGFFDGSTFNMFSGRNPIQFNELEVEK